MFSIKYRPLLMVPIKLVKCFSLSAVSNKAQNHYDSLGLTPKATQADIKSAYYKLSMQYHPDKNKGSEEAAQIFRAITEAYEVLGNLKLRKLYDKGILHTAGPQFAQQEDMEMEDDSQSKFYKSRAQRSKAPPPSGKSPIYNFDEWTQAHYGKSFARREAAKQRYERKVDRASSDKHYLFSEVVFLTTVAILTVLAITYIKNVSYDIPLEDTTDSKVTNSLPSNDSKVTNSIPQKV